MKRKVLFFVMAFAVLTLLVPNVKAAPATVAKIGDDEYSTLQSAIDAANVGDVVELVADTAEDITVASSKDITLDLGTYTLKNVSNHTIVNEGKLTITGSGTVDNLTHGKGALVNKGTAVVLDGTFTRSNEAGTREGNGGNSWYVIDNNGTSASLTFKGGKVVNTSGFSSLIRNLGATLVIEDGTFENNFIVVKNDDDGVLKVSGGTISTKAEKGSAVQNWGTFELTGGVLNAVEGANAISTYTWSDSYTAPTTEITGGTINGNIYASKDTDYTVNTAPEVAINGGKITGDVVAEHEGVVKITKGVIDGEIKSDDTADVLAAGGTYTTAPSEGNVPDGYKVFENEDGTFVVAEPVILTFIADDYKETVEVPKGAALTDEEVEYLKEMLEAELENSDVTFDGFYADEDLKAEFDFTKAFDQDATVYLKLSKVQQKVNPGTSDINLIFILGTLLIGGAGLGFTLKNRKFN